MRTEMLYVGESTLDVGEQTVDETTVIHLEFRCFREVVNASVIRLNIHNQEDTNILNA